MKLSRDLALKLAHKLRHLEFDETTPAELYEALITKTLDASTILLYGRKHQSMLVTGAGPFHEDQDTKGRMIIAIHGAWMVDIMLKMMAEFSEQVIKQYGKPICTEHGPTCNPKTCPCDPTNELE